MMGRKTKLKDGDEWDLLFSRKWYCYLQHSGVAHAIKKRMNRRERRADKMKEEDE